MPSEVYKFGRDAQKGMRTSFFVLKSRLLHIRFPVKIETPMIWRSELCKIIKYMD
jgi:hypothetical protein